MKNIMFQKYHGNGNDFIIIDSRNSIIYDEFLRNKLFKVSSLCDRHFGIGSDGAISSIRTAALPSSDYARVSTVRAANLVCDAMRNVSLRYLGKSFSDAQLAALDAELAGTMRSLKVDGSIQDGTVQTSASRVDRINGRLNLKVQFVPPLSIEAITIDLTVSAPQA